MSVILKFNNKYCYAVAAVLSLIWFAGCSGDSGSMKITQKPLPYAEDALEPYISEATMKLHYGKHHAGYVKKANSLIEKSDLKGETPEEIIKLSAKEKNKYSAVFNNAAQAWNHSFFWESMKPKGGGVPFGESAKLIKKTFGNYDEFKKTFAAAAGQMFGSGWVWLVVDNGQLKITATGNADNPLVYGQKPLLTVDVWEHSYYLDYQNKRIDYVNKIIENLIDWERVELRLNK